jgi:hypothetical protein
VLTVAVRKTAPSDERVVINATDSLTLVGVMLPGETDPLLQPAPHSNA